MFERTLHVRRALTPFLLCASATALRAQTSYQSAAFTVTDSSVRQGRFEAVARLRAQTS